MPAASPMPTASDVPPPSHAALAQRLEGLNLYLIGMMGAGKSAVGRPLAEALGYRFVDADQTIEQAAGLSIPEIFAADGEAGFRDLETAVLDRIAGWHSLVVATGGGVVTRPENWGRLQQGVVVWLDAPQTLLLRRLSSDPTPRPLLDDPDPIARLTALLEQRRPLYAQADLTVRQEDQDAPARVALRVLEALPTILRPRQAPPVDAVVLHTEDGGITRSLN